MRNLLHEVRAPASKNIADICPRCTASTFHVLTPSPANAAALENAFIIDFTLATFHFVKSEFISTAPSKVSYRVVTEAVIHLDKPIPTNFDAPPNARYSDVTLATFHVSKFEFIALAPSKILTRI
jgi:hypothetical protein